MYIKKVNISNFRCFNDFKIELNEGLSILIGENNIGKSNFLEALKLVFGANYSWGNRTLTQDDFFKGLVIEDKWPEIRIEIIISDILSEDELALTSKWLTKNPNEAKLTYVFRSKENILTKLPKEKKSIRELKLPLDEYEWRIYGGEVETNDAFDFHMLSKFNLEFVGPLRDATRELKKNRGILHKIVKLMDRKDKDIEKVEKLIKDTNKAIEDGQDVKRIKQKLSKNLKNIADRYAQNINIYMNENNYEDLMKDIKLLIGNGENIHSVELNGLGYNNLLYIALLITQQSIEKENKMNKYDCLYPILIVEEPEAHLHPSLQKHLANHFFNQKVLGQVIMTSHSTHVTSSCSNLDSLILLYKDNDDSSKIFSKKIGDIFNIKDKKEMEYKRYLERWLDATKTNIFFGRRVLLVEGIAERLIIPELFYQKYGKTLESENIVIISVDGVSFRPFIQLYAKGLDMKCAVITDSDPPAQIIKDCEGNDIKVPAYPQNKNEYGMCDRTKNLINDFRDNKNISIVNNIKTFEYDLILAQSKHDFIRDVIDYGKLGTKEQRKSVESKKGIEFNIQAFEILEKEKGISAQTILEKLKANKEEEKSKYTVNIPSYIDDAFKFIMESNKK